jgi:glucokinase
MTGSVEAIGLDVGATKIAAARVDVACGAVLDARRIATRAERDPDEVLGDCLELARELAAGAATAAVGIALCELVGPDGALRSAETIDWRDRDLGQAFAAVAPARVSADVRAAALAEARHGAGRDEPDFLYVSVGSGISHCLMVGGAPRVGVRGSALATGAPLVERWSSGAALARRTGHADARAALADPAAAPVVADAARRLGLVLAALVNALDPGAIVVGGGLGLHDGYRAQVAAAMRSAIYDAAARELPVRPAGLGTSSAVIGAACAAADALLR